MRWESLFRDIEMRLAEERRQELDVEVAERIRAERARITVADRLAAHVGVVEFVLLTGRVVEGRVAQVGDGWTLLEAGMGRILVPLDSVVEVEGLGRGASVTSEVTRRLGLTHPLRGFARDRARVRVEDRLGRMLVGTIDAVGADAFDLAEHPEHLPRRAANVTSRRLVALGGLVCVTATR